MSQTQKPSRKIIILLSIALILIALAIYNKFKPDSHEALVTPEISSNVASTTDDQGINVSVVDTDGDGLPDWQEILTGTDINKKDSDGDGTSDGEEVKLGRNPTIAGPNDQSGERRQGTTTEASTISESVARNLFANTVYMSSAGNITEDNKSALVNNLIYGIKQSFTFKHYDPQGLKIITNQNTETLKFYASTVATLQVGMILQMQKNVSKIESSIGVLGEIYAKQASDLYAVSVPKELADTHMQLIDNYSKAAAVFDAIAKEKEDPIKLPFAIKTYQDVIAEQPLLLRQVAQFIKDNGILFTSKEAGGYWNGFDQQ